VCCVHFVMRVAANVIGDSSVGLQHLARLSVLTGLKELDLTRKAY
jgi:hypothetical protein